jgi:DnaJ-class molecular chaperone
MRPSMKFQDYYEVLSVPRTATRDEIRKAYRKLALKWHPDRHSGKAQAAAEERFKRISEAWEVLSDADSRKRYDRFGEHWKHGQEFTPPPGSGGGRHMSAEEFSELFGGGGGFSDFFTSLFGDRMQAGMRGAGRQHPRFRERGADLRSELHLPLGLALRGGRSHFTVPTTAPCTRCGGVGFVGEHVCPSCVGVGSLRGTREVALAIPAALRDGMTLRLRGLGQPGEQTGAAGDLLLTLRLDDDESYRRDGADLLAELPLAPWEALSGARVDVRTLDGVVTLTVPPDTRAGTRLRLRGKGLHDGHGGRGDFHAIVRLVLPATLSARQRELLSELGTAGTPTVGGGARESGT